MKFQAYPNNLRNWRFPTIIPSFCTRRGNISCRNFYNEMYILGVSKNNIIFSTFLLFFARLATFAFLHFIKFISLHVLHPQKCLHLFVLPEYLRFSWQHLFCLRFQNLQALIFSIFVMVCKFLTTKHLHYLGIVYEIDVMSLQ